MYKDSRLPSSAASSLACFVVHSGLSLGRLTGFSLSLVAYGVFVYIFYLFRKKGKYLHHIEMSVLWELWILCSIKSVFVCLCLGRLARLTVLVTLPDVYSS